MDRHSLSRRQIGATVLGGFALAALGGCERDNAKREIVRLRQEWFPYAGFAGEMLAAKKYAAKLGVDLSVQAGGQAIDPIKTVLADQDQMGVVSGDILLTSIAEGAPIVAIGVVNDRSPTCFIVKKDSKIKSISDFQGKSVGVLQGTNTQKIYELLLLRNNVNRGAIKEKDIPFELQTFMLGDYDVRPAFIYDEPVDSQPKQFRLRYLETSELRRRIHRHGVFYVVKESFGEARAPCGGARGVGSGLAGRCDQRGAHRGNQGPQGSLQRH